MNFEAFASQTKSLNEYKTENDAKNGVMRISSISKSLQVSTLKDTIYLTEYCFYLSVAPTSKKLENIRRIWRKAYKNVLEKINLICSKWK